GGFFFFFFFFFFLSSCGRTHSRIQPPRPPFPPAVRRLSFFFYFFFFCPAHFAKWSGQDYENPFTQYLGYHGELDAGALGPGRRFEEHYRCYPVVLMRGSERENVNFGGKSAPYPMLFQITNEANGNKTGAGVLEFIAEEGRVYLPNWVGLGAARRNRGRGTGDLERGSMRRPKEDDLPTTTPQMMKMLNVEQGQIVKIVNTTLPTGHFVKIQPQSVDFLDITDPKAVYASPDLRLENAFRNFSTLTRGDVIEFIYNNKIYRILVLEIKPSAADSISIVETDLEVDFAPPVGYEEPKPARAQHASTPDHLYEAGEPIKEEERGWRSFRGAGNRLSGKEVPEIIPMPVNAVAPTGPANLFSTAGLNERQTAPAALDMPFGKLFFGYKIVPFGTNKPGTPANEAEIIPRRFRVRAAPVPATNAAAGDASVRDFEFEVVSAASFRGSRSAGAKMRRSALAVKTAHGLKKPTLPARSSDRTLSPLRPHAEVVLSPADRSVALG
ncbi:MAG: ubiquitin fusion degradation protein UFD1-domain-containing protein, partial [Olpidium bornovanus]